MDELVRFIARSLVDDPDAVQVETKQDGDCTVIELHVAPGDMGKVIGRQGRIPTPSRRGVSAARARPHGKYAVEIV